MQKSEEKSHVILSVRAQWGPVTPWGPDMGSSRQTGQDLTIRAHPAFEAREQGRPRASQGQPQLWMLGTFLGMG